MAQFNYQAIDNQGQELTGVVEAPNEQEAKRQLQGENLYIFELGKKDGSSGENSVESSGQINLFNQNDSLLVFTNQLANLLTAGIQLGEALTIISKLMSASQFSKVIDNIYSSIKGGQSFAEALEEYPNHFSEGYIGMIKAGEEGGFLALTCERLGESLEESKQLKSFIITSLIYPLVLVVVTILAVIVMITYVLPKFVSIYENYGDSLPYLTEMLLNISQFISQYGLIVLLLLGLGCLSSYFYYRSTAGRKKIDRWLLRIPILGQLLTMVNITKIARNLGTMLDSGVPLLRGLKFSQHVTNNIIIEAAVAEAASQVKKGTNLADALEKSSVFPKIAVYMIGIGEQTGKLAEMLLQLADNFADDYKENLKKLMKIFEPVIILVMGLIIGVIVVAMLLPILNINTISL